MNTEKREIDIESLYSKLRSAVMLEGNYALIRARTVYEPAGGKGSKINPPTYPASAEKNNKNDEITWRYIIEKRIVDDQERSDVLLDSVASQANRAELALLKSIREGSVTLPLIEIQYTSKNSDDPKPAFTMTSLELSHRYADAYLRDSQLNGKIFDKTELGQMFRKASSDDATVLYQHDPGSLVFGAWNSYRLGHQAKFPRIYASEVIGWDPQIGERMTVRIDQQNLTGGVEHTDDGWKFIKTAEKNKGGKLSEIGHGHIIPKLPPGGVTVTSAERVATISFAALNRLGFGSVDAKESVAARTVLAAYALLADRLAFSGPSLWLRSGCELLVMSDNLEWVKRGGDTEVLKLGASDSIALYKYAVEQAKELKPICEPQSFVFQDNITDAIQFALTKASTPETENSDNTTDADGATDIGDTTEV